jgi:Tfp pilus assembly ATPase PilU
MKFRRFLPLVLTGFLCSPLFAEPAPVSGQVQELQQKMLSDEQTMALILSLKDDPEMQALLSDPAVVSAVQSGDLSTLTANPRFMKLLDNAKVREIQKRVGE